MKWCRVVASGLALVLPHMRIIDTLLLPLTRLLQGFGKLGGWTAQILHQEMGAKVGMTCAVDVMRVNSMCIKIVSKCCYRSEAGDVLPFAPGTLGQWQHSNFGHDHATSPCSASLLVVPHTDRGRVVLRDRGVQRRRAGRAGAAAARGGGQAAQGLPGGHR